MGLPDLPFRAARDVIRRYGLRPHPEGGHFREVYRSASRIGAPPGYAGERSALTVIYFLLSRDEFSAFHRVRGDEVWTHLAGAPVELVLLDEGATTHRLAAAGGDGVPVVVVAGGVLQAARSLGDWTLVTCAVAPGFEFADFEMPSREDLLRDHPAAANLIRSFTR